jgi:hypothetical protein
MSNVTLEMTFCQQKNNKKLPRYAGLSQSEIKSVIQGWQKSPKVFVLGLSKGKRRYLNAVAWCQRNWRSIVATDEYFARRVGVCRQTINQYKQEFARSGIIEKISRGFKKATQTILSSFFDQAWVKKLLAPIIPAIACFNLSLLAAQKRERYSGNNVQTVVYKRASKNPTQYNSISFLHSSYIREYLFLRAGGYLSNYQDREMRLEIVKRMLAKDQREYISQRKNDSGARKALKNPLIWKLIITDIIQEAQQYLKLDEREMLRCVAFVDADIKHALERVKRSKNTHSPKGSFFSTATLSAKVNKRTPNWKWYYDVCHILGIKPFEEKSVRKVTYDVEAQPTYNTSQNTLKRTKNAGAVAIPLKEYQPCTDNQPASPVDSELLAAMNACKERLDQR